MALKSLLSLGHCVVAACLGILADHEVVLTVRDGDQV